MSSIIPELNTALYTTLSGSTALTTALGGTSIYFQQAPESKEVPFVIWSYQSSFQENIELSPLHQVIVYIRCYDTNPARAGTVDNIIDGLIDGKTLSLSGSWVNYWSAREEDIVLVEEAPSQVTIHSIGAYYRINLDK